VFFRGPPRRAARGAARCDHARWSNARPAGGGPRRQAYWRPGNSEPFLGLVEKLTGAPLEGAAWIAALERDVDALLADERVAYDAVLAERAAAATDEAAATDDEADAEDEVIDLDMRVRIVDGDEVVADSAAEGGFLPMCAKFEAFVQTRVAAAAAAA